MIIEKDIRYNNYEFPFKESEIETILTRLPSEDIQGIDRIIIREPGRYRKNDKEFKYFGRYESKLQRKGIIYLFAHLFKTNGNFEIYSNKVIEFSEDDFKKIIPPVVLHEVGHHVSITRFNDFTEEKADGYKSNNASQIIYSILNQVS